MALTTAGIGLVANTISASILHGHHGAADYNSHAAYLHVLSDALTEIGAIIGILCAMFWNITWIDSAVAVVSALVVLRWAKRLLWDTGRSLNNVIVQSVNAYFFLKFRVNHSRLILSHQLK